MAKLIDIPEAGAEAAKFAVPSDIHPEDYIYQYHLDVQTNPDKDKARAHVTEYYFWDGDRSAQNLDTLVRKYHPAAGTRRLSLLEFASGYGCVSRHLRKMRDTFDLVACDIHPAAVEFLHQQLAVDALPSRSNPSEFDPGRKFDVVFALSFFSHMPDRTFGNWIAALFGALADDGLLIFTTHGRNAYDDVGRPALDPGGYWFAPVSEQRDLAADEYGCMVATPLYVMQRIARCEGAAVIAFHEAFWWGTQDLFVVRKVATDFRPSDIAFRPSSSDIARCHEVARLRQQISAEQATTRALGEVITAIHRSTSWRVTAPLRMLRTLFSR